MIRQITFKNFRVLRETTLTLGPMTLLIGPNGSGKTTVLDALRAVGDLSNSPSAFDLLSASERPNVSSDVGLSLELGTPFESIVAEHTWARDPRAGHSYHSVYYTHPHREVSGDEQHEIQTALRRIRVYGLDPDAIAEPRPLKSNAELLQTGEGLPVVLDQLRDQAPERFEALNEDLGRWIPEFNRIRFTTTPQGARAVHLRTREGNYPIPASQLSAGTRFALVMLTLAHLPAPPPLIGIEEPDRGIHPRLLRDVQDALYRLSHPKAFGDARSGPSHRDDALALPAGSLQRAPRGSRHQQQDRRERSLRSAVGASGLRGDPKGNRARRGVVQRRTRWRAVPPLKLAVFGEDTSDEAAVRILVIDEEFGSTLHKRGKSRRLRLALGLAVPAAEAWYLCGIDGRVSEAAWMQALVGGPLPYTKPELKEKVYGSSRPGRLILTERARHHASRLAGDVAQLEAFFPNGFGVLARTVRAVRLP
jgi:energy-coupling factor transporter ATP-binding protein EcfA2